MRPSCSSTYDPFFSSSLVAGSSAIATSSPGSYPAAAIPTISISRAASFDSRSGAKPPSSPTAVLRPRSCNSFLSAWKTSSPARSASEYAVKPTGTTMNSWKSTLLSAWAPPFSTFIIGTGSTCACSPPR